MREEREMELLKKLGFAMAFIGAITCFVSFREGIAGLKPAVDLYADETDVSDIGYFDMVNAEVIEVLGSYATKTTTKNGVKQSEESYYIIPAFDGEDVRYIGVKVLEKEYKTFDKMVDDTYNYFAGYSLDLGNVRVEKTGCLKKMNKEMQKYYYEWFEEAEWYESEEEMKQEVLPIYLDAVVSVKTMRTMFLISVALLVVGAGLGVLGLVKGNGQTQKAVAETYVMINGVSYPKSSLAHVNTCIEGQERIFAAQELAEITGLSLEEAGKIVENWKRYYH